MTISMDKQYRTRDGKAVRIYAVDAGETFTVHGAVKINGKWYHHVWTIEGRYSTYAPNCFDLIEVKPRIQREYWMNLHKDYMIIPYPSKESADEYAMKSRIACVKVVIDCEEGEGLVMDIVKWLRQFKLSTSDSNYNALIVNAKTEEAADEIDRLRQQNAELVGALQAYKCDCHPNCWEDCEPYECDCGVNYCGANANRAIAKATGGE